jgi:hypothetical protein
MVVDELVCDGSKEKNKSRKKKKEEKEEVLLRTLLFFSYTYRYINVLQVILSFFSDGDKDIIFDVFRFLRK